MKKKASRRRRSAEGDTLRPESDFRGGARGVTARRYAESVNVVVNDPDVLDVFPDATAVNETLRALAPGIRHRRPRSA